MIYWQDGAEDLKQLNASAVWDASELFPSSYKKQSKSFYNNYLKLKQW